MANVSEIAPDVFRISVFASQFDLEFNHFLVRDDEPLLFHTGLRGMHKELREAVARLIPLKELRHISFSHFESDECGALHEWLGVAPDAQVSCSRVGALVSVNDFIGREARGLADGDTFTTGKYRFRHVQTPHLPHGWDAGVLHEETQGTLFCSDLFHQTGACAPITADDVVGRSHEAMRQYQAGILADYMPYTPITGRNLEKLAALEPKTLAVMHGSSFRGDGRKAIHDIHAAFRDVFGASVTPDKAP
jgi:flavorubredoxin